MTTTPVVWSPQQTANTSNSGSGGNDQFDPQIVALPGGRFVVLWSDNSDSGPGGAGAPGNDITGQVYDVLGAKIGGEFLVNVARNIDNEGRFDAVATGAGFAIVYEDTDASGTGIVLDSFTVTGAGASYATGAFGVIQGDPGAADLGSPTVEANSDGSLYVYYMTTDTVPAPDGAAKIVYKTVSADGATLGAQTDLLPGANGVGVDGQQIDSARLYNGNHVVFGKYPFSGGDPLGIIAGGIVPASGSGSLTTFGIISTLDLILDETPAVAALRGGGFVVVWTKVTNPGQGLSDVFFQRFNDAGVAQGSAVSFANTGTSNNNPSITELKDGGFVIAWEEDNPFNSAGNLRLQRFDTTGAEVGLEVVIASNVTGIPGVFPVSYSLPKITELVDGRLAVTYTRSQSGDQNAVFTLYDPRELTVDGSNRPDLLVATPGNGTVNGFNGADTIYGWTGSDTLNGGDGADALSGGDGTDSLSGDVGNDFLTGGAGNDNLNGGADFDYANYLDTSTTAGITLSLAIATAQNTGGAGTDTLTSIEAIYGSSFGDTLTGDGAAVNALYGWGGADLLTGAGGFDYIEAGEGDDTLDGGAGDDYLLGGNGTDWVSYYGSTAAVYVDMSGASAFANGTATGFDVLSGIERVYGSIYGDFLFGSAGSDTLVGDMGIDIIYGFGLGDSLDGGGDTDYLVGGAGADTITTGAGQDYIYFQGQTEGKDTITDWRASGFDILCIDEPSFGAGLAVNQYLSDAGNANRFVVGTAATAAIGQFLWNSATSTLSWDADGTGAGAAVQLVTLTGITSLNASDILVL